MRVPLVAGNWKMHTTVSEARSLARDLVDSLNGLAGVEVVVCPPFVSLVPVKDILSGSSLKLGAQNMHAQDKGAFTGEVSPAMLRGICDYVILGHSERRHLFGEGDEFINAKVHMALESRLNPVLCVGETLEEREANKTEEVLTRQMKQGMQGVEGPSGLVIAYEPVWAIGTGRPADGMDADSVIGFIRSTLAEVIGPSLAEETRILYGGSVNPRNIQEFMSQTEIDGALVGGASLVADDFMEIVRAASEAKGK